MSPLAIGLPVRLSVNGSQVGMYVTLLLIGGLLGLTIGVGLVLLYLWMAKFFAANARALDRHQKATKQMARQTKKARPVQPIGTVDHSEAKDGIKAVAKAGN
jgi:hypothetical protein